MNKPLPGLIHTPQSGDFERASDIVAELHAICKKRGIVIAHQQEGIVIAKVTGIFGTEARVIAHVRQITPEFIEWREIDWTPPEQKVQ